MFTPHEEWYHVSALISQLSFILLPLITALLLPYTFPRGVGVTPLIGELLRRT